MKKIEVRGTLIGAYLEEISTGKLMEIFEEITNYKNSGILQEDSYLAQIMEDQPEHFLIRDIEYEILYELSRRFYNFYNSDIDLKETEGAFAWLSKMQ